MPKMRIDVPNAVRAAVLDEFDRRCAVCRVDRPQVHHIDENPSNTDPANLIPLCPNCHYLDEHNPYKKTDPGILALFRSYKDPFILAHQFIPVYVRMTFLDRPEILRLSEVGRSLKELCEFLLYFNMGEFYADRIEKLLRYDPVYGAGYKYDKDRNESLLLVGQDKSEGDYYVRLRLQRPEAYRLVVEMLRYQPWSLPERLKRRREETPY
jgi:hypothetical protein